MIRSVQPGRLSACATLFSAPQVTFWQRLLAALELPAQLALQICGQSQMISPFFSIKMAKRLFLQIPHTLVALGRDEPWRLLPASRISDNPPGPLRVLVGS